MSRLGLLGIAGLLAFGAACTLTPEQKYGFDDTADPDRGRNDTDPNDTGPDAVVPPSGTNNPPRANAVATPTDPLPGDFVTLNGSGSTDLDNDPLDYAWAMITRPSGSVAALSNADQPTATLYVDRDGDYEIQLCVSDGVAEDCATVRLTAQRSNLPPVADAGFDQRVNVGDSVQLSGAGSSDPDGDTIAAYNWTFLSKPPGSVAQLSGASNPSLAVSPTFVADAAGLFTIQLRVNDGELDSNPDIVTVTASDPNNTTGSSSSSSSSGGCLDCGAAEQIASTSWTSGNLASSVGLLALPVFVLLAQRRREDDEV